MGTHLNLRTPLRLWTLLVLLAASAWLAPAHAEPYLAVKTGQPCGACHFNPTGGGLRTVYGDVWSETQMPQQEVDLGTRGQWLGEVGDWFRVGGNLRYDASFDDVKHQKKTDSFGIEDFRLFGEVDLIRDRLALYIDELIAPGGTQNREAYGLLWFFQHQLYIKGGQMYLPFGFRLQDDEAFVQQASLINYTTPDNGVELGLHHGHWDAQLAVTNGSPGTASDTNQGKQVTANLVYVLPGWRLGGSYSDNEAAVGRRNMQALYAGVRTGPIAWLGEAIYIFDSSVQPRVDQYAGLLEGDWAFMPGNNLKLTAEYWDPNVHVGHAQRNRFSVVWEYTPMQFVQTRLGFRDLMGIPQDNLENSREGFAELNLFF